MLQRRFVDPSGSWFLNTAGNFRYSECLYAVLLRSYDSNVSATLILSVVARVYLIPPTTHLSSFLHHPSSTSTPNSTTSESSEPPVQKSYTITTSSTNLKP